MMKMIMMMNEGGRLRMNTRSQDYEDDDDDEGGR
jgi:hypothetical protein